MILTGCMNFIKPYKFFFLRKHKTRYLTMIYTHIALHSLRSNWRTSPVMYGTINYRYLISKLQFSFGTYGIAYKYTDVYNS